MSHELRPIPGSLLALPVSLDLAAVVVATALIDVAVAVTAATPVRAVLALPLLLFLPGYASVSACFPSRFRWDGDEAVGVNGTERLALSFGVSLCLVGVVGLALATAPVGITPWSVTATYTAIVLVASLVALVRRALLPEDERFQFPLNRYFADAYGRVTDVPRRDAFANVALAVAVLAATATVGYGLVAPAERPGYDTLSILTESDDGDLVAADYPSRLSTDSSASLVLTVENNREGATAYTVVVQFQRVAPDGTVTERAEADRFSSTVGAGETWEHPHEVSPPFAGDRVRLTYLLYRGEPPASPTRGNADHEVHLWLTVPE